MKVYLQIVVSVVVTIASIRGDGGSFSYNNNGPERWPGVCRTGKSQSPINIPVDYRNLRTADKGRFYMNRQYWRDQNFYMTNTGHTVQLSIRADLTSTLVLQGDTLPERYVFSQLHFHWGSSVRKGSEHTINDYRYPIEAHLVHYASRYQSLTAAIESNRPDALAVVGVFYNVTRQDNPRLKPIVDNIKILRKRDGAIQGSNLNLRKLLPVKNSHVFQYYGSLTTPGCNEVVFWNVVGNVDSISESQLKAFRSLIDDHGDVMQNNDRPVKTRNNRPIRYVDTEFFNE